MTRIATRKGVKRRARQPAAAARALMEELEPRLLLSADAASVLGTTAALHDAELQPVAPLVAGDAGQGTETSAIEARRRELIIIDPATPDYERLLADLGTEAADGTAREVVVLRADQDGIAQLNAILARYSNLSAIHLISHGADGEIFLGNGALDLDGVLANAQAIQGWGQALTADGDLLIYGCNVAADGVGQTLIDTLSRLTGADVAASADLTGAASQGGDWDLEAHVGSIETLVAVSNAFQQQWLGVLVNYAVSNTNNTGAGSLRDAIAQANATTGVADVITFSIGSGAQTITLGSTLTISDQVTINGWSQPGFAGTPLIRIDGSLAGFDGLTMTNTSDGSVIQGLTITRFRDGIEIAASADNITIRGNWIGTTGTGTGNARGNTDDGIDLKGSNAIIGGTGANDRNVITNNADEGINSVGSGQVIQGNYIGLDPDGSTGGGNVDVGIALFTGTGNTIGGLTAAERNVISMNNEGIEINSGNNSVLGNYIGTDAGGTLNRGNRVGDGIQIQGASTNNTVVGGTAAGAGNLIAFNAGNGVSIFDGTGHQVLGNSIFSNSGLGIDLGTLGVTANDANDVDGGDNNQQNFPVLSSAATTGTQVTIGGTLNSVASTTYRIEFFANTANDNEGQRYLGFTSVTTPSGSPYTVSFTTTLTASVTAGEYITATATDPANNTSEFSATVRARGTAGLWLSSVNNATAGGITWDNNTVVHFGDPGLSFEPGTTAGVLVDTEFDLDRFGAGVGNLNGLHYVSRTVTVGSANAVTLLPGDVLFSTAQNETLGGVSISANDIALFRPTTPGNYSAGTFSVLLQNPMAGNATRDFALVETATVLGGVTLNAGDFLLTAASGTYDKDVTRYQVTDVGPGTTSGTRSELIDGGSAGIGFTKKIFGLELVQANTTLGGKALTAGQLLISLDANDTVGSNSLSVSTYDIFVLTVTATGTGTSSGSAALLVQGSDIGLTAGGEEYDAIALLPLNNAPVLDNTKSPALTAQNEDSGAPSGAVGTLVSSLVDFASPSGQVDNVTDVDSGASTGIAVTAADTTNGTWWYSINNGTNWFTLGGVTNSSARLLAADGSTRLYFQPNANYNGTLATAVTFRAWDRSDALTSGALADTSVNGDTTAFSTATDTASLVVNAVNDAPTATDRALSFDGTDLVVIGAQPNLIVGSTLTMEAMVQRNGAAGGIQIILNKEGEYELGISATGKLQWAFANTTPGWTWVETSYTLPADTWAHVAVTYNGGVVKTYVNGALVDTYNGSGVISDFYPALNDLIIGGRQNTTGQRFSGLIDEVRVWNVERSAAEILAAYNTALAGNETGLVGYWRFNESSGTTAVDGSTQGYNGVLGNGVPADVPTRTLNYTTTEDNPLVVPASGVLTGATDPEGSPLTAILVSGPTNAASFTLNANGSFSYTPTANFAGTDSFVFVVNDGTLNSQSATVYLTITPVNDAPTLGNGTLAAVAEDTASPAGATVSTVFSGQFSDVDSSSSFSGIAVVANTASAVTQGVWQYSTNGGGNWFAIGTVAEGATALAVSSSTLIRFLPVANYNGSPPALVVRGLDNTYAGGFSTTAGSETRVNVNTTTNGGATAIAGTSANLSTTINAVNDAPVLAAIEGAALGYTENAVATAITSTVTLSDVDNATMTSATVQITTNYQNGQDVLSFTNTAGIVGSWNAVSGTLTLTGSDTVANYQAALRAVKYANLSDNPSTLARTVSFIANDGTVNSNTVTRNITVTAVNDAPVTTPVTLVAIAEDSGPRVITQAELLANATDVDGPGLSATGLAISSGLGSLVNNGNGTWTYTPALNDDTAVSFSYSVTDGSLAAAGSATLDITPVNDAPGTSLVTLTAIVEDSGPRLITQAELLANATDVDGPSLSATGLAISSGSGTLVDNGNGTWTYTPALNDDTAVSFTYTVTDGSLAAAGTASLDITPVNDAPVTTPVTLTAIVEDSGSRLITQAELLANATDVDSPSLTATGLAIASGSGTLVNNGNGTWTYTPALNDDTAVSFSYTVTDGTLTAAGSATLDITPVNDAPVTSLVTLTAIAEDSGPRLITQAELLANATDVDSPSLTATGLTIASGAGTLVNNFDGTWTYTPALNDDTAVSFSYTVTDGSLTAAGTASLDITPVNDAPVTSLVTLTAIAEDSGPRLITQAELLANATDVDSPSVTATGLTISSGSGTLVNNFDGTWTYTPALNDDTAVSFSYTVTDGSLTAAGTASLDITPINNPPVTSPVTLTAIAEDSIPRLITQAELLANATDVDSPSLTAGGLVISSGLGSLVDNFDGTWTYTPALNDDTAVSFTYTVTDGSLTAAGSATLDITPVNDAPVTTLVTLTVITEDSGPRPITQAELLANATDVDSPSLTATGLAITVGSGTLIDNGDGTWTYTPALNDDTAVSFSYTVTDGTAFVAGTASLDITPANDAPLTTPVTLTPIAEDSGPRLITQAELLANATDVDSPSLTTTGLAIASGSGTLVDNFDSTWTYTPALNDDTAVSFTYTVTDGSLTAAGSATLDITPVNDAPTLVAIEGTTLQYLTTGPALPITATLTANDVDSALLTGATVTVSANYISGEDVLGFLDQNGITGSWDAATGVLTLSGSATLADYQAALRSVTYTNLSTTPSPLTRTVSLAVSDGGTASALAARDVTVTALTIPVDVLPPRDPGPVKITPPPADKPPGGTGQSGGGNGETAGATGLPGGDYSLPRTVDPAAFRVSQSEPLVSSDSGRTVDRRRGLAATPPKFLYDAVENIRSLLDFDSVGLPPINNAALWKALDTMNRQMSEFGGADGRSGAIVGQFAGGAGMFLSIGFVNWVFRGGSLAAAMLSTMPMWRGLDPLPVLLARRKPDEDEEKEQDLLDREHQSGQVDQMFRDSTEANDSPQSHERYSTDA